MTPDQLVCELFIRQGYLVMESSRPFEIGETKTESSETFTGTLTVPIRIVGHATHDEFKAQCHLAFEIAGEEPSDEPTHFPVSYFYRVEAID